MTRSGAPIEQLGELRAEAARRGDGELAARRAGAARHVGERVRARAREASPGELAVQRGQPRVGHPAQDEVLLVGRAQLALAVLRDERREGAELRGRDVAEDEADHHRREPDLLLGPHAVLGPRLVAGLGRLRLGEQGAARGGLRLRRQDERYAALLADRLALGVVLGDERGGADLVDRPLEAAPWRGCSGCRSG